MLHYLHHILFDPISAMEKACVDFIGTVLVWFFYIVGSAIVGWWKDTHQKESE